ncbi:MAG TPA: TldD/PmbA family protein [Pseudonocardiaceae bacterium]|nr:TldD/PmbA family protein [Pseudonocardiaceae bacterium]
MTAHDWGDLATGGSADAVLDDALGALAGVEYADVRLVEGEELRAYHQLGQDPDERVEHTAGIGVRVLRDGAWGFASAPLADSGTAASVARRAVSVALAGAGTGPPVRLPAREPHSGSYTTDVAIDPFAVPSAERDALLQATLAAAHVPGVISVQCGVNAKRQHRHFASTEGSRQHQHLVETGGMLVALAAADGQVQRRSYPNSFHGNTGGSGWEFVAGLNLPANAARVGAEAVELLSAPTAPAGVDDLVIGAQQVSLQIHESAGHALELDRILGDERNFAGTSFISTADVGALRYGSPAVSIISDPTMPGTRGSFAFDDEGTPAGRVRLIDEGVIRNTLSTRDSAARAGLAVTGAARSDGWGYLPVCFSTHVYLEPGSGSLDELLDRLGDGYYIEDNRSWSIDNRRLNFQFGTEVAYEVRHGRKGRLLRDFSYGGVTPRFWNSVEAVAGQEEFRVFGYPCGKGEPKQWGFLSHAASPLLARGVRTGVA